MTQNERLDEAALRWALAELDGWKLRDGKLYRKFEFRDFRAAFGFMVQCALAAEAANHHPEWSNVYSRVEVSLTTHDANGVTPKDIALAREMNAAARAAS